jgi:hypothetical protein
MTLHVCTRNRTLISSTARHYRPSAAYNVPEYSRHPEHTHHCHAAVAASEQQLNIERSDGDQVDQAHGSQQVFQDGLVLPWALRAREHSREILDRERDHARCFNRVHNFNRLGILLYRFHRLHNEARGAGNDQHQYSEGDCGREQAALGLVQQHENCLPHVFSAGIEVAATVLAALQLGEGIRLPRPSLVHGAVLRCRMRG